MESVWLYIFVTALTGVISFIANFYIRKWAISRHLTQKIRERDVHKKPVPRIGGLAIFISFWLVMIGVLVFCPEKLSFVDDKILGIDKNLFGVFLGSLIIFSVMLIDDLKGIAWSWKLLAQIAAAVAVVSFGITINWVNNPFDSLVHLQESLFHIGSFSVSWGQLFVIIWIVLVMNVVNWLDGLDGLAGGIVIISALALFLLAISPRINQGATALLAIVLVGSVLGFMPFNWNPARLFLGDTGSMFIGYILAILAIISGGKVATAALVMGIALLDGIWVILNRLIHRKSPFQADNNHLHHRLLRAGFSVKQAVITIYFVSIIFGYLALKSGPEGKFWSLIWLIGVMIFLSLVLAVLEWVRKAKSKS